MLPARERVGLDADQREQARHGALDLVAQRLRLGIPGESGGAQRADDVERHARGRARRVDGHVGCVAELLELLRAHALRGKAVLPRGGGLLGLLLDGEAVGLGEGRVDPGLEALRGEVGERQRQVADVALGVDREHGDARQERLLEEHDGEAGLAGAGHAEDDAVRGEVGRPDDDLIRARLAGGGVDDGAEVERSAVCHGAESRAGARRASVPSDRVPADRRYGAEGFARSWTNGG